MLANEYIQKAIKSGITKPICFRGFNHCWESNLIPMENAISVLENEFTDYSNTEIELSQSGIDEEFPNYMVVYFLD